MHGPSKICTHASSIPIDTFGSVATGGNNNGCEKGVGEAVGVGVIVGLGVSVGVGVGVFDGVGVGVGVAVGEAVGVGLGVDAVYWIVSPGGWRFLECRTAWPSRWRTRHPAPASQS